jgi:hypothetical protein
VCLTDPGARILRLDDEFFEIGGGEVLPCDDQDRGPGGHADRLEVLARIVFEVGIERGSSTVRPHVTHHDRVAIGFRLCATGNAGSPASAGNILDNELLAEGAGEMFAHNAGDDIGGAARGERYDNSDRAGGIVLRGGRCRGHRECGGKHRNKRFHRFFPL